MRTIVLDVWREVGRHLELPDLVSRLAGRLADALPVAWLAVRAVDPAGAALETVASAAPLGGPLPPTRTALPADALKSLLAWCAGGAALLTRRAIVLAGLAAALEGGAGEVALVPLRLGEPADDPELADSRGLLAVGVAPGRHLRAEHHAVLTQLAEPFAAALANDRRIRAMGRLREAAEAEARALLTRLGRQSVSDVIVGGDSGLRTVMQRVELVARSDVPVLLLGETGTGKEVIARAIHQRSPRAGGPLIRVNCGAIPPELIDSELFGHERGSFTGATATRKGWFERADGGTLFLDEIGDLPAAAQVRLLRVLQDGTFERVGGQTSLTVSVRVVGATHRDLHAMVREHRFREDLWYRLCVFPIDLPPLRDRLEDLPALAAHFALKAARRLGLAVVMPTPADLALLSGYTWPGNIRELASVIERAAILGNGRQLEIATALGAARPAMVAVLPAPVAGTPAAEPGTLDAAMAGHIQAALQACHGRVDGPFGAARRLGLNPHTLRGRMRKLGIDWRVFRRPAGGH